MIPKIIHYCWFGKGKKSIETIECLNSLKKLNFEIKEWNEDNYDISKNEFTLQNHKDKKWAFVSDYVRLDVLYEYGGIYVDTDVKILKNISEKVLETDFIIPFQFDCLLGTHFIGSKKNCKIIKEFLNKYKSGDYKDNKTPNNHLFTDYFLNINGFKLNGKTQELVHDEEKINVYEKNIFSCPDIYGKGVAIHRLNNSWKPSKGNFKKIIQIFLKNIIGEKLYYNLLAYKAKKKSPYYELYKKSSLK
ncbi:MAG: glycosyltransferase family 32 protein [Cetobacterium sp.]|uniref:glycosyltransferase family 32 protein n=1 Tax=Cetobacterium sp. TaxID=2071632 RepID=UPI003EE504EB